MSSLEDLTAQALARDPARRALGFKGHWHSWGEMRGLADRVAGLAAASGAAPAAPVGLVARNHPAAVGALLGLIASRRTVQMIYAYQSPAAIARDIARLRPAIVVAMAGDLTDTVLAALRDSGAAAIALADMDARSPAGFAQARAGHDTPADRPPEIQILTSGTTGAPKQFAISYDMIARHLVGSAPATAAPGGAHEQAVPTLIFMPLGNISGIYTTLPALLSSRDVILLERFTLEEWLAYVREYRPQAGGLPPSGVQMVLDAAIPREDLACMKTVSTGAAPLDPTVQKAFEDRYGIPILLAYGATEFGGPVTAMTTALHAAWGAAKFASVGRPLGAAQLRAVDPDSGAALAPGSEGLLEVISPRIGPDWIRTSDIGMIDADGFVFLRGRADGAINRGGFKLLPETIERALLRHPAIAAAAVVGLPDRRLGQVPAAAIQLKPGAALTEAQAEAHLRDHVPATHIPVGWRFVADLPKNASMKVDRPAVRGLFEAPGTPAP